MEECRDYLKTALKDRFGLDFEPEITPAPENIDADYSTNAPLKLAKELHQNPMQIAEELKTTLEANKSLTTEIEITAPGFLNFNLPNEYFSAKIADFAENFAENISWDEYQNKTIICEFSDPNPFKVLHVGHLYTSVVGDAISRLFEYADAKVIRANFGGDVGLHVAKTMYALLQKSAENDLDNLTIEDIAKCYIAGTASYEDDPAAEAEITKLNKKIYQINASDEHGFPLADLYWRGRELSYEYFDNFYASIGLKFDKYYPESTVAALGLKTVEEQLQAGVYEKSNGAVVFNGEKYGLHTRVFINNEGVPTYEAKDVGLIFTKWQDYHFDKSVIITGNEQLEYMKVVLKSIEQYAPDLVEKTAHLTHGLVKLPGNVKMSSRKGNFLKAIDVLDLVRDELKTAYNSTDEKVSLAATKYAFLKYKMGGNIIFDPKESVKMTGNSGPYLLYSAVRAKKILEKSQNPQPVTNYTYSQPEKNLAKKLLEYKAILKDAVREMAPHKLANFLFELAQEFSRFYENCPVAGSAQESERKKLVQVYLAVMTHGLNLLGIKIPEEM
jgi:arginyl-tRNA synthetase